MQDQTTTAVSLLQCHPLTAERWSDLEELFGERGACGGCWCMWWRLPRSQFARQVGEENRRALKALVDSGQEPGILAYVDDAPIAWCSVGPREVFPRLERSRILKRVDDQSVWSVVCFFVARPFRRKGLMVPLLEATVDFARKRGARVLEGYPVEINGKLSGYSGYTGIASAFARAGFVEVLRRAPARPIVRRVVADEQ